MTTDTLDLDLDQLYLDIDPTVSDRAWQQSQTLATPTSRWRAYINQLGLQTVLPYLKEEARDLPNGKKAASKATPMLAEALLPTIWEWISGTAVTIANTQLVLLPTDALDSDELRVPQEWLDIPTWASDYYVQLQVNPDDSWVKIAGFTTHLALKEQGTYDWSDRTYTLPSTALTPDLNVAWISQTLAPNTVKQAAVAPLPALSLPQANNLITRLANPTLLTPRLEIDFATWSALMAHGGWRKQLAEQRWGRPSSSVSQWLQSGNIASSISGAIEGALDTAASQLAQQLGWQNVSFQPALSGARSDTELPPQAGLSKTVEIDGNTYALQISPVESPTPNAWRFALRSNQPGSSVPAGVTLRLLTEDLQPFDNNEAIATEPTEALY
ncbi:MAG: DUF1822 family protein, partial [Cyanobacteria bacterium J06598_3]